MGVLNFGGRGHTCVIYSNDEGRIIEYGRRAPAFRVLVNTSAPQGSTGITTGVFPAMTLGCGAAAGNSTGDNVGPMHLLHVKRIARRIRSPEEAFLSPEAKRYFAGEPSAETVAAPPAQAGVAARVDAYLADRGLAQRLSPPPAADPSPAAAAVDRFLSGGKGAPSGQGAPAAPAGRAAAEPVSPPPPAPVVRPVSFVCESDVRKALAGGAKIYIAKRTIVTPAARDLDADGIVLVQTES